MVSNFIKNIREAFYFMKGFIEASLIMPTALRKSFIDYNTLKDDTYSIGAVTGSAFCAGSPVIYCLMLVEAGHYDINTFGAILGTQVAINLGSGLYEICRYAKRKIGSQAGDLEEKVEEPTNFPKKFINPFEIEVPELNGEK